MNLVLGSPGRYVQEAGAIADSFVRQLIEEPVRRSCAAVDIVPRFLTFDGEMTASDVVIAAGGGQCIDVGKAPAEARGAALTTWPTVASNDAPASKNYVVYDERHQLVGVGRRAIDPQQAALAGS